VAQLINFQYRIITHSKELFKSLSTELYFLNVLKVYEYGSHAKKKERKNK